MKIRNNYVSNSSSSSFIIIGKQVLYKDIKAADFIYVVGKELNDGMDVFQLTPDIKEIFDKFNASRLNKFKFYVARGKGFGLVYGGTDIPNMEVKSGDELIELDKDYHSSENLNDILDTYDDYYFQDDDDYDYGSYSYRTYAIIGEELQEVKDFDNVWCYFVREEKGEDFYYVVKMSSKEDLDYVSKYERKFYRIDHFMDNGFKFKRNEILNGRKLYWIDEHYRFKSIKEVKKHHGK